MTNFKVFSVHANFNFKENKCQIDSFLFICLQTFIHHLILWGSILLSFLWFTIYGALANLFWDMYYVPFVTMATVEFWSVCALSAVLALLPRYSYLFGCLFFFVPSNRPMFWLGLRFSVECRKPTPNLSVWPITTDANNRTNQSGLEVYTRNRCQAREDACMQVTIGFGFTSDWLRKWRDVL